MAIRIRKVGKETIAICAAISTPITGDIYLDDAAHHALSTKFALDWESEGIPTGSYADKKLVPLMLENQQGQLI